MSLLESVVSYKTTIGMSTCELQSIIAYLVSGQLFVTFPDGNYKLNYWWLMHNFVIHWVILGVFECRICGVHLSILSLQKEPVQESRDVILNIIYAIYIMININCFDI